MAAFRSIVRRWRHVYRCAQPLLGGRPSRDIQRNRLRQLPRMLKKRTSRANRVERNEVWERCPPGHPQMVALALPVRATLLVGPLVGTSRIAGGVHQQSHAVICARCSYSARTERLTSSNVMRRSGKLVANSTA